MRASIKRWAKKAIAAFIGGFSGAAVTILTDMGMTPEVFNLNGGLKHTLLTGLVRAAAIGMLSLFMYLQKAPVPEDETIPPAAR